jgi:hypothetical protein
LTKKLDPPTNLRVGFEPRSEGNVVAVLRTFNSTELSDYRLKQVYISFDKMPQWLQTKIIKLQLLPIPPPKIDVYNIGSRMADNAYWVVLPEDEADGDDTRIKD